MWSVLCSAGGGGAPALQPSRRAPGSAHRAGHSETMVTDSQHGTLGQLRMRKLAGMGWILRRCRRLASACSSTAAPQPSRRAAYSTDDGFVQAPATRGSWQPAVTDTDEDFVRWKPTGRDAAGICLAVRGRSTSQPSRVLRTSSLLS